MSQPIYSQTEYKVGMKRAKYSAGTRRRENDKLVKYAKSKSKASRSNVVHASIASWAPSLRPGYFKSHLPGAPQKFATALRYYAQTAAVSLAASTFTVPSSFTLNGCYDPDFALTATQPAAFSTLMGFYTKCCVKAAKITVVATNPGTTSFSFGLTVVTSTANQPSTLVQAQCGGPSTSRVLTSALNVGQVTQSVDMAKFLGVDDLFNNPDYSCTNAANPAQIVVAAMWVNNDSATTAATYQFRITVDYDVIFYDPAIIL